MISIVNYLFEFHGITDDMAFEAAKRLAKSQSAESYDVDNMLYKAEQATKKLKDIVPTTAALSDDDQVSIWSKKVARSPGGKTAHELLKKRFKE